MSSQDVIACCYIGGFVDAGVVVLIHYIPPRCFNKAHTRRISHIYPSYTYLPYASLATMPCILKLVGVVLVVFSVVVRAQEDDDWVDPFDMLNYDATTKSMRKSEIIYDNVPTKRREYIQDSCPLPQCPDVSEYISQIEVLQRELQEHKRRTTTLPAPPTCPDVYEYTRQIEMLQRELQEHKRRITPQKQPTCYPIFRRFLAKLLKETSKLGLPNENQDGVYYDAMVHLTRKTVAELQKIVDGQESWSTGSMDEALSKILINFKPHDHEAWTWRFEDTFPVELDTVVKMCACILMIVVIICSEAWSTVSWFVQFKRMFAICFFISIVWNWFYLYKIAFAEHQSNIAKMESVNEKCTGVKKIDWSDSLREWFRRTWTLQDDPCKKYYEVLMVNPILLVPPTKAISVTITTFITEPLKHFGQGISEFLIALLKDLPVTLQIPVLLTIVIAIVLCTYGSATTAIQHMLTRPLKRGRRDPPPPHRVQGRGLPQLQHHGDSNEEEEEGDDHHDDEDGRDRHHLGGGDAPPASRSGARLADRSRTGDGAGWRGEARRGEVRQRRPVRAQVPEQRRIHVETLRNADSLYSGDEMDLSRRLQQGTEGDTQGEPEAEGPATDTEGAPEEGQADAGGATGGAVPTATPVTPANQKEVAKGEKPKEQAAVKKSSPTASKPSGKGSGEERTAQPAGQKTQNSTLSAQKTQNQGPSSPREILTTTVEGINAEETSSSHNAMSERRRHADDAGVPVQETGQ